MKQSKKLRSLLLAEAKLNLTLVEEMGRVENKNAKFKSLRQRELESALKDMHYLLKLEMCGYNYGMEGRSK